MDLSGGHSEMCTRLVFEAVNQNSVSKLHLAERSYGITQLLKSLIQCNDKGETPLVIAMRSESDFLIYELVQKLQHGNWFLYSDIREEIHQKLCSAINQISLQIPILKLIEYLMSDLYDDPWLKLIAQAFIKSTSFTRQDKIIALELIGASLIITIPNAKSADVPMTGLECLRAAMTLRYSPADGEHLLPKIPDVCVPSEASSVVFGSAVEEVMTLEELDQFQEHFQHFHLSFDALVKYDSQKEIQRQALLVIRSICSQAQLNRPYHLYLISLVKFGEDLMTVNIDFTSGEDSKLLTNVFLLIMEQMNGFDPKLLSRKSFDAFTKAMSLMSTAYFMKQIRKQFCPEREELPFTINLLAPIKFIPVISKFFLDPAMIYSVKVHNSSWAEIVFRFLYVHTSVSHLMTHEEKQELEEHFAKYLRNFPPIRQTTVLHAAVKEVNSSSGINTLTRRTNAMKTVKLIIKLGADPNAINEKGQTPLHFFATIERHNNEIDNCPLYQTLMDAGSHLDLAEENGGTLRQILKRKVMQYKWTGDIAHSYFESLINTVFPLSLSCYAARVIRRNEIPLNLLPPRLQEFVSNPNAQDSVCLPSAHFRGTPLQYSPMFKIQRGFVFRL